MVRFFYFLLSLPLLVQNSYGSSETKVKPQVIISSGDTVIESEGIKFKGFRDLKPLPFTPARILKINNDEESSEKIDCYNLKEIWLSQQFLGRWKNELGTIAVYKIKLPVPNIKFHSGNNFVTKTDYEKWLKTAEESNNAGDPKAWIKFIGDTEIDGDAEILKTSPVSQITHYKIFPFGNKYIDAYIVTDTRTQEHRSFLFVYEFALFSDIKANVAAAQQSVQSVSFQNAKEVEAKQLTSSKTTLKNKEYTDEYYEARQKVINGIKDTKGWWFIETPNYIIVSNMKDKKTAKDIEKDIEKARSAYKTIFPPVKQISSVSVLKIFNSRPEYLSYVGRNMFSEMSLTWLDTARNELSVSPDSNLKGQDVNKKIIDSVLHESIRQYIYSASGMKQFSPWFDAGCANFFSGFKPLSSGAFDVEPTIRMELFVDIAKRKELKVESILSKNSFETYNQEELKNNHLMAWGLIYFLFKGANLLKNKNDYSEIPLKYYNAVANSDEIKNVTDEVWKNVDLKKFNEDFNTFWTTPALVNRSKTYNPFDKNKKKAD